MTAKIIFFIVLLGGAAGLVVWFYTHSLDRTVAIDRYSEHEAGFEEVVSPAEPQELTPAVIDAYLERPEVPSITATSLPPIPEPRQNGRTQWSVYWQPFTAEEAQVYGSPIGPFSPRRVGIQVGHWQRTNLPEELRGLENNSGAVVSGYSEAEVMYEIATLLAASLTAAGVSVDILPVTIPIDYQADAFISLHADGSNDTSISGFKIAAPRTDFSGRSVLLKETLDESYARITGMPEDFAVTRRMTGYYAFNWRRYNHAVHPQTPAVIVETGFLTNPSDRSQLVNNPELFARALSEGILSFLQTNYVTQ